MSLLARIEKIIESQNDPSQTLGLLKKASKVSKFGQSLSRGQGNKSQNIGAITSELLHALATMENGIDSICKIFTIISNILVEFKGTLFLSLDMQGEKKKTVTVCESTQGKLNNQELRKILLSNFDSGKYTKVGKYPLQKLDGREGEILAIPFQGGLCIVYEGEVLRWDEEDFKYFGLVLTLVFQELIAKNKELFKFSVNCIDYSRFTETLQGQRGSSNTHVFGLSWEEAFKCFKQSYPQSCKEAFEVFCTSVLGAISQDSGILTCKDDNFLLYLPEFKHVDESLLAKQILVSFQLGFLSKFPDIEVQVVRNL